MARVFLIVLDSCGVGEMPDAADFGDEGSFTLRSAAASPFFSMPNAEKLGLFHIDGVRGVVCGSGLGDAAPDSFDGVVCRLAEISKGKDTTTGHWEIAGLPLAEPFPTFPEGFPKELLDALSAETGRGILCNKPYSGTEVIRDYGKEHLATGDLIVYTSADSVLQIAAHDSLIPTEQLYEYCEIARRLCVGQYGVGRIIARPFTGEWPYTRTALRHDFSLEPTGETLLDVMSLAGFEVRSVGKIVDIFAGRGITSFQRTTCNEEGIDVTLAEMQEDFSGLCFTNLVDFDMKYGHRNDVDGYAKALSYFDTKLPELLAGLREDDPKIKGGVNVGTRIGFSDIGKTVAERFAISNTLAGEPIEELL